MRMEVLLWTNEEGGLIPKIMLEGTLVKVGRIRWCYVSSLYQFQTLPMFVYLVDTIYYVNTLL